MRRIVWLALAALGCASDPAREADRPFTAGVARVERIHSEVRPSRPPYARVVVTGRLPDACTELDRVEILRPGFGVEVTLTTRRASGARFCPPLERSFEKTLHLPVDAGASGLFVVTVNGVRDDVMIPAGHLRDDLFDPGDIH